MVATMQTLASLTLTSSPLACMLNGGAANRRRSHPVKNQAASAPPPPGSSRSRLHQNSHSWQTEKCEVFKSLESWASEHLVSLIRPVERCWQPNEFLPDATKPIYDFMDEVQALRERTDGLPDDLLVALVGHMVTEEGVLHNFQSGLNSLVGVRDETGTSSSPWATWIRAWTAEENRHGDLLRTYLYLSGRVDMLRIERTVHHLIGAGMDHSKWENNPYLGFVYTSFQERATFLSHINTARLAKEGGDPVLAKICGTIAADEKRHENVYVKIIEKLLEIDPNETMVAIGKMLKSKILMPGHLMYDGRDPHLYQHFAHVAHRIGVYTPDDYTDVLESLIGRWRLEKLEGLQGNGKCEQEFVCSLPRRIKRLRASTDLKAKEGFEEVKFSWIFDKTYSKN